MAIKVKASTIFRKNTPGMRLGSIKRMAKYRGQLYSFQYTSLGPSKTKKKRNEDRYPVILLAYKDGSKIWEAKNKKRYIYGFNINYLPALERLRVVRDMQDKLDSDIMYSYPELRDTLKLPTAVGSTIFRKYDVRGSKLRLLKEVDLDKYVNYLDSSIEMRGQEDTD